MVYDISSLTNSNLTCVLSLLITLIQFYVEKGQIGALVNTGMNLQAP
jgi:hypothetical protein